ncbi:MAG: type site-specific deoxyribonuclease, HsdR family [Anaerolineales bacterium]|nr:type site-specific deoxyribonuclease, HsdR family [Anaerolineales bacterium]
MDDEIAFYDVLEVNDSAVKVLSDETLRTIAYELVRAVKSNLTIDWTVRENVRAQMYLAQIRLPPTSKKKPR